MSGSNATLVVIYLNIFLYALCYQMQRPLEPFLVDRLVGKEGSSANEYARLQSFFFIVQTLGSLFIGRLIDSIGYKWGFMLNFLASGLSYFILSESRTLFLLYLSKLPTVFQAGFLCAQVAVTRSEFDGASRVTLLGRLTTSYTIGSVVGPYIGGMIGTSGDYYFGAKIACLGSIVSMVLCLLLPSQDSGKQKPADEKSEANNTEPIDREDRSKDSSVPKASILKIVKSAWLLLSVKIVSNVANAIASSVLPIIFKDVFKLSEYQMGVTMSIISAFNALITGLALSPIVALANGDLLRVITTSLTSLIIIQFIQGGLALPFISGRSFAGGFYEYFGLTLLSSMAQFVLANSLTSEATQCVEENSRGTLIGLEHSIFAAARVVAPTLGVALLSFGGISAASASCGFIFLGCQATWLIFKVDLVPVNHSASRETSKHK